VGTRIHKKRKCFDQNLGVRILTPNEALNKGLSLILVTLLSQINQKAMKMALKDFRFSWLWIFALAKYFIFFCMKQDALLLKRPNEAFNQGQSSILITLVWPVSRRP